VALFLVSVQASLSRRGCITTSSLSADASKRLADVSKRVLPVRLYVFIVVFEAALPMRSIRRRFYDKTNKNLDWPTNPDRTVCQGRS
jgi:hypothetical protein